MVTQEVLRSYFVSAQCCSKKVLNIELMNCVFCDSQRIYERLYCLSKHSMVLLFPQNRTVFGTVLLMLLQDSLNERELVKLGIIYVLNVSRGTTKPPFVADQNFMRIPVDDNYDAVMTPYFAEAFKFIGVLLAMHSVVIRC